MALARAAGGPLGILSREKPDSGLSTVWSSLLSASGLETVDCASGLGILMAAKDEAELVSIRRAANLSSAVLEKCLLPSVERVVDEGGKARHSALAERAMAAAQDPAKEPVGVKLKAENVEVCYPFCVQSGGEYDLKWTAGSNDKVLVYDPLGVVVVQLGCRYKSYCSTVGRTYLIDPPKVVSSAYEQMLSAHSAALDALRPGVRCCDIYAAALGALPAELAPKLVKSLGWATGLEFREASLVLSPKCEALIQPGMVFAISTGLSELPSVDGMKGSTYVLLLSDTAVVLAEGAPDVLTRPKPGGTSIGAKFALADVSYVLNGEHEGGGGGVSATAQQGSSARTTVLDSKMRSDAAGPGAEARRKAAQDELATEKNAETLRRLTEANARNAAAASSSSAAADFHLYKTPGEVPNDRLFEVSVDRRAEAVLLPIAGQLVPFHIGTVKNASATQEGAAHFIRIYFHVPGTGFGGGAYVPAVTHPHATFMREATFRSADGKHTSNVITEIKSLRAAAKARATETAQRASLVRQDALKLTKGRVLRLIDVWVRPAFGGRGRKLAGTLECHVNGFRYSTAKSEERLDIIFANIRHAFFQPSERELITLLHFHLIDPIMVGKKKTRDVQVFAEVMDAVQNLDGARRSMYDPDEIEDEQRERERRNRVNAEFLAFTKRCAAHWETECPQLELEFDIPFRELGFAGVPNKTASFIMPTVNCLVDLVETPFLVIALEDIEVVNLERVGFALKNFDMAIVFKDFTRDVHRIDAVDVKSLDTIKEWLTSVNIKYYESRMNLNWKPILRTILDDPEKFVEEGGWCVSYLELVILN